MQGRLSKTEQAIYDLLRDGRLHNRDEILSECLGDGATYKDLRVHMSNLRKKIPRGQLIDAVMRNGIKYRLSQRLGYAGD